MPISNGTHPSPPPEANKTVTCEIKQTKLDKFKTGAEIFGIALLLVYTIYTAKMYCANRDAANAAKSAADTADQTLKDTRKSFVLEMRPYLIVENPSFVKNFGPRVGTIKANVTIKDIGKTPGKKSTVFHRLIRFSQEAVKSADYILSFLDIQAAGIAENANKAYRPGDKLAYLQDLAPSASFFSTAELKDGGLSGPELSKVKTGDLALLYIGIVKYKDPNTEEVYETEFCWEYFGVDPNTWHDCPSHNTIK